MSRVRVDTSRINRILKNLDGNVGKVVRSLGFAIERKAKEKAAVDTGAMRSSIYVRTYEGTDMPGGRTDVERVELPQPPTKTSVTVGPSVAYSVFVEFGTATQAAQPFLTPAVSEVENDLVLYRDDFGRAVTDG